MEEGRRQVERADALLLDEAERLPGAPARLRHEAPADEVHRDERVDPHRVVERHHAEGAVGPAVAVLERLRPPAGAVGCVRRARHALGPAGRARRVEQERELALVAPERPRMGRPVGKRIAVADHERARRSRRGSSRAPRPRPATRVGRRRRRPKGVPRSHAADRAGGWSQALQHGYGWADAPSASCRSTTRWGSTRSSRCTSSAGASCRRRVGTPGRRSASSRSSAVARCYLAPTSPRPRPPPVADCPPTSARCGRWVCGRCDDSTLVASLRRRVLARGLREPLRLDRGLHLLDRTGPAARSPAAPGGPRVNTRMRLLRPRRDLRRLSSARGLRRLLEPPRRR